MILNLKSFTNKKLSPSCNYIIWLVFIIALIFPVSIPSKISIYNYIDITGIKTVENNNINESINLMNDIRHDSLELEENTEIVDAQRDIPENYLKMLVADIWFVIFLLKFAGVILSYNDFVEAMGNNEIKDKRIIEILERCKTELKIKKKIKLIEQDLMKMPALIGVLDVKILFSDLVYDLSDEALKGVLMHELSHYKRKDNLTNMLGMIMKAVHWFNPMVSKCFVIMKSDIECATDEMAVNKMSKNGYGQYCKILVEVAGKYSSKEEKVMGMASAKDIIERRINMIFDIKELKRFSTIIMITTAIIVILMCLLLYPSSYGTTKIPEVYLKSDDENIVELVNINESEDIKYNTINLDKNSKAKLVTKSGKIDKYVYYSKINVDNMAYCDKTTKFFSNDKMYFDTGENFYEFVIEYGTNKKANYIVKVIVE